MSHHTGFDELVGAAGKRARRGRRGLFIGLVTLAVAAFAALLGLSLTRAGPALLSEVSFRPEPPCTPIAVRVTTTVAAVDTVTRILAPLAVPTPANGCLSVTVDQQEAAQTVAGARVLPVDRAPDLWIPDSEVWAGQATGWRTTSVGSLGSTPVVLATSQSVASRRGWVATPPSWVQAVSSGHPMMMTPPQDDVASLLALTTLWTSLGRGADAAAALVGAQLTVARTASVVPDPSQALVLAQSDSADAPLVPTTEQAVYAANRSVSGSGLTAVYPADGSPLLTFPVLRIDHGNDHPDRVAAINATQARLLSKAALALARDSGFRMPGRPGPTGRGVSAGPVRTLPPPSLVDLEQVQSRTSVTGKPPRLLAMIDMSRSMAGRFPDGSSKAARAAAAAVLGVNLLPDRASAGVWLFCSGRDDDRGYEEISPVRALSARVSGGISQREHVTKATTTAVTTMEPGGPPPYTAILAAVRSVRQQYDPRSINAVVVFTDGAGDRKAAAGLPQLLDTLRAEAIGGEPVPVFAVGIGPAVRFPALEQIAKITEGRVYRVSSPEQTRAALLDGLASRVPTSAP